MPLFIVTKEVFDFYRFGKRDIELRTVESQWKNSKAGDIATIHCGRRTFIKRITKIHRGSIARIFLDINYKRIFPEASTMFEAVKTTKELYPDVDEFIAFELKDVV